MTSRRRFRREDGDPRGSTLEKPLLEAKGMATRNKGLTTGNKKLLVTSALLLVTRSY